MTDALEKAHTEPQWRCCWCGELQPGEECQTCKPRLSCLAYEWDSTVNDKASTRERLALLEKRVARLERMLKVRPMEDEEIE